MKIEEISEDTMTITYDDIVSEKNSQRLISLLKSFQSMQLDGIIDYSISYTKLMIYYEPMILESSDIEKSIRKINADDSYTSIKNKRIIEIPVCYDDEFGLDLNSYYKKGLTKEEIQLLHSEREYYVYMIGFLPGFPYLNGVNDKLIMARKETPRTRIPKGSVGIAGSQTGFYTSSSPGGWNIIGRTPLKIGIENDSFNVPYRAGDYIKFTPINRAKFDEIEHQIDQDTFELNIEERGF
ncbi:MAG TPA: 5-oxoprolinase subunit PxpB [Aliicoccus persicus]|uniref:5-oxoprolinase subunit PxpB n=1 Tax=Aliicoccus persicus TaxID=930138 RepID=A0A921JBL7_9STAP|nr:5-oxoprolinase subunit PxpB [Aliicoccus persicus]